MMNIEHNKLSSASISADIKRVLKYIYCVINNKECDEIPSNLLYPIVEEIINRC